MIDIPLQYINHIFIFICIFILSFNFDVTLKSKFFLLFAILFTVDLMDSLTEMNLKCKNLWTIAQKY